MGAAPCMALAPPNATTSAAQVRVRARARARTHTHTYTHTPAPVCRARLHTLPDSGRAAPPARACAATANPVSHTCCPAGRLPLRAERRSLTRKGATIRRRLRYPPPPPRRRCPSWVVVGGGGWRAVVGSFFLKKKCSKSIGCESKHVLFRSSFELNPHER